MLDTPTRKPMSRQPQDARREQLIQATIDGIDQEGLSNITLNSVARRAGLTAGMVNFHFDTKQQLLTATLAYVADEYTRSCNEIVAAYGSDPAAALLKLIDTSFDPQLADPAKIAVWYAFWGETGSRDDYVGICGRADKVLYDAASKMIGELTGDAWSPLNAAAAAKGLCGLIDGLWQDFLLERDAFDRAQAIALCRAYLANLLPDAFGTIEAPSAEKQADLAASEDLPRTLPAATYHDQAFFADEMERIHLPAWQMVCHTSDIPGTGDYQTFEGLGKRAFVIRGDDGTVRAFHNVCPHRAHAVVSGAGTCAGPIRCPYHSWAFDFEGNLKAIAAKKTFPPFDNGKFGLTPLECEVFMGFVYIRFLPGGASVAERYGPHADELASYRIDEMVPITPPHAETMAADWKNVWDNYLEDYHFPTGHPGLFSLMNMQYDRQPDGDTRTVRLSHTIRDKPKGWAAELYARHLPDMEHLPEDRRRRWSYIYLYPAVSFDIYPDMIDFFHVVPTGPGRSTLHYRAYGLPDADRALRVTRRLNQRINYQVGREDTALIASVQQGLESGSYDTGVLSDKEDAVKALHAWVREDMRGAKWPA